VILTADAETVRRTNRREAPNGWSTSFIGANRNTIKPGEAPPAEDALHPVAFLVEKRPGGVTRPHFHRADQYQVVVGGSGKMGLHDTGGVAVHYTDAFSAYGPIVAAGDGIAWFTLRPGWDPGAKYMENPDNRAELRASRGRHAHWETTTDPVPPLPAAALAATPSTACEQVLEGEHGLATWRYRLPPGATLTGPDPARGGGQFWLVLAGTLSAGGAGFLGANSTIFAGPEDGALAVIAGPGGAEALCLQFRVPYAARR
jgi:phage tail protein X